MPQVMAAAPARPAGQVFAAALHAARTQASEERSGDPVSAPVTATPTTVTAPPQVVAASVDPRQDAGLHTMVDHIERLRDLANAADTRIRLVPDALGGVDIALRREGEAVHVHLRTDTAHAAHLLAEAQPRLADIAEARGVRIAGTTIDSNGGSAGQPASQQQGQPAPRQPAAAVPAAPPRPRGAEGLTPSDARVA